MRYAAIDVEKLNPSHESLCSIGVAVFEDGTLVDNFYSLVCPPEEYRDSNIFSFLACRMRFEDVMNAPTFDKVWKTIENTVLRGCTELVAHNASVDFYAIYNTLNYYGISFDENYVWSDTLELSHTKIFNARKYSLECISHILGVNLEHHHNAYDDALACGEIYWKLFNMENSIIVESEPCDYTFKFDHKQNKTVSERISDFPLSGKKVVISGVFDKWGNRECLKQLLSDKGVYILSGVSKNCQALICGSGFGPTKFETAINKNIPIYYEEDIVKMLG